MGLKGLAVRLRMARPIQSQLFKVGSLQLFPISGRGADRGASLLKPQHTRPLSKRSLRAHCNAGCSASMRIAQRDTGRPVAAAVIRSAAVGTLRIAVRPHPRKGWSHIGPHLCMGVAIRPHPRLARTSLLLLLPKKISQNMRSTQSVRSCIPMVQDGSQATTSDLSCIAGSHATKYFSNVTQRDWETEY